MELDIFTLVCLILFAVSVAVYIAILVGEWIISVKEELREKR